MDKISLVNRALGFLGEEPITSWDKPHTKGGRILVSFYDQTRREVLRKYPWNFCETWTYIDKTVAPIFFYSDAYSLPQDYLRLLIVGDPSQDTRDYRILNQGSPEYRKVIALNNNGAAQLPIAYNCDIEQLSLWDPLACKVFALQLALDNAKAITGQDALVKLMNDLLSEELKDAAAVDGQEQSIRQHRFSNVQTERDYGTFGDTFTNVIGYS